jgi:hypothetical protein
VDPGSVRSYGGNAPKQPVNTETEEPIVEKAVPLPEDAKTNKAKSFRANGYNTIYNSNDQISQVGQYKDGQLWNGKWYQYNQDGILIRIEVYKDGKYVGNGLIEK